MAAHSHHLWPDVTFDAHVQCWSDAAALAERKWDKVFADIYPQAQGLVARELSLPDLKSVVFAPNTHALLTSLLSAWPDGPARVLSSEGESIPSVARLRVGPKLEPSSLRSSQAMDRTSQAGS